MGDLVGSALRTLGSCPLEINLRPPSVVREQDVARRRPFLMLATLCLLLSLASWCFYFYKAAAVTKEVTAQLQSEAAGLEVISGKIDKLETEKKALSSLASPILQASIDRSAWSQILEDLGSRIPARNIWITELKPLLPGAHDLRNARTPRGTNPPATGSSQPSAESSLIDALEVKGLYLDEPTNEKGIRIVDEFVDNLKSSKVVEVVEGKMTRITSDHLNWAYGFTLTLKLRNPILLP